MVREAVGTEGKDLDSPDTLTFLDFIGEMIAAYDGTNAREVMVKMEGRGFVHSAIPDAGSFILGVCSQEEVSLVKEALRPPEEKIIKAHLVDIVDEHGDPVLQLRALDGRTHFTRNIERGSFVINCTDHIPFGEGQHEPVLSDDGLVLTPQGLCGFSGPTANICTHLFYTGRLEPLWRKMPRGDFSIEDKCKSGLEALMLVVMNNQIMTKNLPEHIRDNYLPKVDPPPPRSLARFTALMPRLMQNHRNVKGRYTDKMRERAESIPILGGNLEGARSKL